MTLEQHLTSEHGFRNGEAQESAAAQYLSGIEELHVELHNPDYYEHLDPVEYPPPNHTHG